ncbi:phage major capsid protein [Kaistia terrae]|uniref:Phage major capsid protein n=1 Tax=Kaistia terrae TaxID=537017 RepID=A0ABW0Q2N8_9HYPH|nr:phage major capsid protein [Kaistia terrae]MCX5581331.1 phage major capsid protein [Kaistia terrae]
MRGIYVFAALAVAATLVASMALADGGAAVAHFHLGAGSAIASMIAPVVPRGLQFVRAETAPTVADLKAAMDLLGKTFAEFRTENDNALKSKADGLLTEKVDRLNAAVGEHQAAVDDIARKIAALQLNGNMPSGGRVYSAEQLAYFASVDGWMRGTVDERDMKALQAKAGFQPVSAAMTTQSQPDGGFLTRPELDSTIDSVLKVVSPMRSLATVRSIGGYSYSKLVNQHGTTSGWVGEGDNRVQTLASQLSELSFPAMELYAMPAATQTMLDDSFIDLESWISDEVTLEFAQQEGAAFVSGNGVKRPWGFLAYENVADANYAWGKLGYVGTGVSGAFPASNPADVLIDLFHALKVPYRNVASWTANNKTLGTLRKLKDGQGNYLININFKTDGVVSEMLGRPVVEIPDMPDIAANSYGLAFGDFKRGYLIVDRVGIRILRDPYTAKPYVLFYTTKRVGGGIQNFEAIKLLRFG